MDVRKRQPIGIELVKRGIVKESDIENALQEQKKNPNKKIGEILNELKVCDSQILIEAIGDIIGVKGMILSQSQIKIEVLDYVSLEIVRKNRMIPFEIENGKIKVCFADTTNTRNIETVRLLMLNKGLIIDPYITFGSIIDEIISKLKISKETFFIALSESDKITYLEDDVVDNLIDNEKKELNSLTEDEMLIYKYYVLHKLSQSEIAKLMNTSQSTISRKIKNLKKKYKK